MDSKRDQSLLHVITHISHHFGPKAVLKGGMALRLQGIDRSTIDADFTFQPTLSKKDFSAELISLLNTICDTPVTHTMNSKHLKIDGLCNGIKIIVEANPHTAFEPQAISTSHLANKYHVQPRIISIMPNEMAFANKLGAWLERRLARDLYDIYVYLSILRVQPNKETLFKRIQYPSYAKNIPPQSPFNTIEAFILFLKKECDKLNPQHFENELSSIIAPNHLPGLAQDILIAIRQWRIIQ